jgi:hypothetical protein
VRVFKLNGINIAGEDMVTTYYKKKFLHPLSGTDENYSSSLVRIMG